MGPHKKAATLFKKAASSLIDHQPCGRLPPWLCGEFTTGYAAGSPSSLSAMTTRLIA